jgi:hypothetical protein
MHPDIAWTPWYRAPDGVPNEECRHRVIRESVGPTSRRRSFSIVVDSCRDCGRNLRTVQDVSWRQYDWLRRFNRQVSAPERPA